MIFKKYKLELNGIMLR